MREIREGREVVTVCPNGSDKDEYTGPLDEKRAELWQECDISLIRGKICAAMTAKMEGLYLKRRRLS